MRIALRMTGASDGIQAANVGRAGWNTLWLGIGRVGTQSLMLVLNVLIARRLGEAGLGHYAFIASAIALGNVVTTFGTDMILVRHIAATRDLGMVPAAVVVQLCLSVIAVMVVMIMPAAFLNLPPDAGRALRLYSLALIPLALYTPMSALLRGIERMNVLTRLNLSTALGQVALAVALIRPGSNLVTLAAILLAMQLCAAALALVVCLRTVPDLRLNWRQSTVSLWALVRLSAPLAALAMIGILYQRMNVYQLTLLGDSSETGWYVAAARLADAPKLAHYALMGALFPVMAQSGARTELTKGAENLFKSALLGLLALSAGAEALLFALAKPLTFFLFGPSFGPTIPTLRILALSLIPFTFTTYFSLRFFTAGYETQLLILQAVAILLLAIANLFAIPRWGAAGGAASMVFVEILLAISYLTAWRRLSPAP